MYKASTISMAEFRRRDVQTGFFDTVMTSADLAPRLDDADWRVLDCRFDLKNPVAGRAAYAEVHIPGAMYVDLDQDLAAPVTGETGRHPLPDPGDLAETFGRLGIDGTTQVVVYDDAGGALAARAWWLLRWLGHERVALLDGGLPVWQAEGRPVENGHAVVAPRRFVSGRSITRVVTTDEVVAALHGAEPLLLLDARAGARFRGEVEPIDPVAGHIPGAVNLPFSVLLDKNQRFRSPAESREAWAAAVPPAAGNRIAAMCGSGVTACHLVAAARLAGLEEPAVYVGSWSEWIRDPARPVGRDAG